MTRWAIIRHQFEGFHCYPDAPEEVAFLRLRHRHMFYVTLQIEQFHDNRDLEFFLVKRWLNELLQRTKFPLHSSCEMMAEAIGRAAQRQFLPTLDHSSRRVRIEVSEDGENGALIEL